MTPPEAPSVRGDLLASLLRHVRLSGREWAVVVAVLLGPAPLTAREIARRTRLAYPHAKALVRSLAAWGILERGPGGVSFQAEAGRWGPPAAPSRTLAPR